MKYFALMASAAAIRISEVPQAPMIQTPSSVVAPLPNRVPGNAALHKPWPTPPVAAPLPLQQRYGQGDTVTALHQTTEVPQAPMIQTPSSVVAPLPNRVPGNAALHKPWPTPPVAAPLPLQQRYGQGDTVTALHQTTEVPQAPMIQTPSSVVAPLPNRVPGNAALHKPWPTPPVAAPLPLQQRYGQGDTVTALHQTTEVPQAPMIQTPSSVVAPLPNRVPGNAALHQPWPTPPVAAPLPLQQRYGQGDRVTA